MLCINICNYREKLTWLWPVVRYERGTCEQFHPQELVVLLGLGIRSTGQDGSGLACSPSVWIWSPLLVSTQNLQINSRYRVIYVIYLETFEETIILKRSFVRFDWNFRDIYKLTKMTIDPRHVWVSFKKVHISIYWKVLKRV